MRAWVLATVLVASVIAGGWVFVLNPTPVTVHLAPDLARTAPLGALLLAAFLLGGLIVLLAAGASGMVRAGRDWRVRRVAARARARADATARARMLVWSGATALARRELARAGDVARDPERAALVAESHLEDGQPQEARRVLEAALAVGPPTPELLDLLATAADAAGDHGAAVAALERARALRPESPRLLRRLRDAYAAAGRLGDALPLQSELLLAARTHTRLADEAGRLRSLRIAAALADPDHRRAARALYALAAQEPSDAETWCAAGDRWLHAGDPRRARRTWRRGLFAAPDTTLIARLATHDAQAGRPEQTRRALARARRRRPDDVTLALGEVRLLLDADALDDAAAALDALPEAARARAEAHALRGELCRRRGDTDAAAAAFAEALASSEPTSNTAHQPT